MRGVNCLKEIETSNRTTRDEHFFVLDRIAAGGYVVTAGHYLSTDNERQLGIILRKTSLSCNSFSV